jgi:hypothetical protein
MWDCWHEVFLIGESRIGRFTRILAFLSFGLMKWKNL